MHFYAVTKDFAQFRRGHTIACEDPLAYEVNAGLLIELPEPPNHNVDIYRNGAVTGVYMPKKPQGLYKHTDEAKRRLSYHPVKSVDQQGFYEANRGHFMDLFSWIEGTYDSSRERSEALTCLQQSLMWLNAHVACNGVGVDDE